VRNANPSIFEVIKRWASRLTASLRNGGHFNPHNDRKEIMILKKAFEPQRRKERKVKTVCYWNLPSHPTGEYLRDIMSLFSLRLSVFAVSDLRFLG
jgi:hypothetical protein